MPLLVPRAVVALAVVATAGCGPSTRAFIGVSKVDGDPTVRLYVCDDQPHLTIRVYYGSKDADNYTLTGSARGHETVEVSLAHAAPGWKVGGTRVEGHPGVSLEADAEDGSGNRLGSSVYFHVDQLPDAPAETVRGGPSKASILTPQGFAKAARAAC